jgi:hypothetical protein
MNRQTVSSSNIASIWYDTNSLMLQIEFSNGSVYKYYEVPKNLHEELMNADSHWKFLNTEVKPHFRCEEL